jgi:hypothetical protein
MKLIGVISAALIGLCACSSQQPTQNACVVAHGSGFVGAGTGQEHIIVAQNGSPCVITVTIGRGPRGQGEVVTLPTHGTATVRFTTTDETLISYTPTHGYAGADRFEVAFGPNFIATVLVQVVPAATGSGAPR